MVLKEPLAVEAVPTFGSGESAALKPQTAPSTWRRRLVLAMECVSLLLTVTLAGGLRLWNIQQNGWGTAYYTAAVRSGMESWHNFFFNSLDPGGFVCVDKPPVALWVQVLSAKLFGFNQLSVLVPQAVMGTLSVFILWHLVRRRFGPLAAFLAALALAVMPISVAVERTNNTDACLAFVLLLSGWALLRAAKKGSLGMLLLSMVLVGVAFNTKMLAAFVVLPTFYLVYLLGATGELAKSLGDLALATFVVFGVSLSWAIIYDLTPEDQRPYADSTQNNSMITLIVEHNGMDRFLRRNRGRPGQGTRPAATGARPQQPPPGDGQNADGQAGRTPPRRGRGGAMRRARPRGINLPSVQGTPPRAALGRAVPRSQGVAFGPGGGPGGPGGRGGIGWGGGSEVGLWRLAHPHMAGQVLWFFPLAFVGFIAAAFQTRWSWTLGLQHQALLLWLGWLVTYVVVYSFAGGLFHDYYVATMSAPMAALTGIAGVALWKSFAHQGWRSLLLPLAIVLTAAWPALVWLNYPELAKWAVPTLLIATTAAGLGLLALRGSWWGPVFAVGLLACVCWLWSRDREAPDILAVAAEALEKARTSLRETEGWDSFKKLYTKFSPDIGTLLPDLRRQAPLISPALLLGGALAGGGLLVVFLLARWRPILGKAVVAAVAVSYLALYISPGVWALSPLWGTGGMLPAADATVFSRAIREREQRAQQAVRAATLTLTGSHGATAPGVVGAPALFVAGDLAVFTRGQRGAAGFARGFGGPGVGRPGSGGSLGGPGTPGRDTTRSRQDREKLVAFLKANHHDERWLLAVSGAQQASSYIIEDGLSVMPMGGFSGGSPTFGSSTEETKARLTKLVEDGQIRFFQVASGRSGFPGGFGGRPAGFGPQGPPNGAGPNVPQGGGRGVGGPILGLGRGNGVVNQWVLEQVEKGKARKVQIANYTPR